MRFIKDWISHCIKAEIDKYVNEAKICVTEKYGILDSRITSVNTDLSHIIDVVHSSSQDDINRIDKELVYIKTQIDSLGKLLEAQRIHLDGKLSILSMDVDYKITGLNKVVMDRLELLNLEPKHTADLMRRIAELEGQGGSPNRTGEAILSKRNEYADKLLTSEGSLRERERYYDAVNLLDWVMGKE